MSELREAACECRSRFRIDLLRAEDYKRFKRILNIGRHPAFVGPATAQRHADNGGMLIATFEGQDVAAILVNSRQSVLLALNVVPAHRSHGLGAALVEYVRPNFARVLMERVPWFVKQGYEPIGELKMGRSLNTQIMVRSGLREMAGRVHDVFINGCQCDKCRQNISD